MRSKSSLVISLCGALYFFLPGVAAQAQTEQLAYVESVSGGADPNSALPMLVLLHGLGDRPEHFLPVFESLPVKARLIAPRAPDPAGDGGSWYPYDGASPEQMTTGIMARALKVAELI